jgi:tetratricopeptide (TPR) repeat protein
MHRLFEKEISTEILTMRAAMENREPGECPETEARNSGLLVGSKDTASVLTEVVASQQAPALKKVDLSTLALRFIPPENRRLKYAVAVLLLIAAASGSLFFLKKGFISGGPGGALSRADADRLTTPAAALRENQFTKAAQLFELIVVQNPSLKGEALPGLVKALLGQAAELSEAEPDQAERLLVRAADLNPENPEVFFQQGLFYTHREKYQKAIGAYLKAAELNPQHPNTLYNLGYIYAKIKQYREAEKLFERTVKLSPPFLDEALFNLAMVQRQLGKKELCVKNLKLAIESNPNNKLASEYLKRMDRLQK